MKEKIYQHKDKSVGKNGYSHEGKYQVLCEARMKNPTNGEWHDCIIYQDVNTLSIYVREKSDFYHKFELTEKGK